MQQPGTGGQRGTVHPLAKSVPTPGSQQPVCPCADCAPLFLQGLELFLLIEFHRGQGDLHELQPVDPLMPAWGATEFCTKGVNGLGIPREAASR